MHEATADSGHSDVGFVGLSQSQNGWGYEEEIGELEEVEGWKSLGSSLGISAENFFLALILIIVVFLGIFLYVTRKRHMNRPIDS